MADDANLIERKEKKASMDNLSIERIEDGSTYICFATAWYAFGFGWLRLMCVLLFVLTERPSRPKRDHRILWMCRRRADKVVLRLSKEGANHLRRVVQKWRNPRGSETSKRNSAMMTMRTRRIRLSWRLQSFIAALAVVLPLSGVVVEARECASAARVSRPLLPRIQLRCQDERHERSISLPLNDFSTAALTSIPRGGWFGSMTAGMSPFGYKITDLGEEFLRIDGSLESDVGRFLAGLKKDRKRVKAIKEQWLEILRVAKTGQAMRIYRSIDELIQFCLKAGFID